MYIRPCQDDESKREVCLDPNFFEPEMFDNGLTRLQRMLHPRQYDDEYWVIRRIPHGMFPRLLRRLQEAEQQHHNDGLLPESEELALMAERVRGHLLVTGEVDVY